MPVRLGHFYASVLLLVCLGTNIAFFTDLREHFLGAENSVGGAMSALSELDIKAKIADFYPAIQSNVEGVLETFPSLPLPAISDPVLDLFLLPASPQTVESAVESDYLPEEVPEEAKFEEPVIPLAAAPAPVAVLAESQQMIAATVPAPAAAVIMPVVADQFKPITVAPKMTEPLKPSASPVWDTVDTLLRR